MKVEDDGFVQKVVTQIFRNLHITIEDVHIRYEDDVTNPDHPFTAGVTLKRLALESTNDSWVPSLVLNTSKQFFKLVSLESLSVYWLSGSFPLLHRMNANDQLDNLIAGIATTQKRPYEDSYIVGPITSYAKCRINTRPDLDGSNYSIPKYFVNLTMEEIAMGLTPRQYEDIISLLHAFERMSRAAPFRKHRARLLNPHGANSATSLWIFAYECILEANVRRRRRNWQWSRIKQHRQAVRAYMELYKIKLTNKRTDAQFKKDLDIYEDQLDVFNITLARRQAEVQVTCHCIY